ncbi:MAG: hypothetical protein ACSHX9_00135 [Luteolibacter sp.]
MLFEIIRDTFKTVLRLWMVIVIGALFSLGKLINFLSEGRFLKPLVELSSENFVPNTIILGILAIILVLMLMSFSTAFGLWRIGARLAKAGLGLISFVEGCAAFALGILISELFYTFLWPNFSPIPIKPAYSIFILFGFVMEQFKPVLDLNRWRSPGVFFEKIKVGIACLFIILFVLALIVFGVPAD